MKENKSIFMSHKQLENEPEIDSYNKKENSKNNPRKSSSVSHGSLNDGKPPPSPIGRYFLNN